MSAKGLANQAVIWLFWASFGTATLLVFGVAKGIAFQLEYTEAFDTAAGIHLASKLLAYGIAFFYPLYLLHRDKRAVAWVTSLAALALLFFWRWIGVGLVRLDCYDSCVNSVVPLKHDNLTTMIVFPLLVTGLVAYKLFVARR